MTGTGRLFWGRGEQRRSGTLLPRRLGKYLPSSEDVQFIPSLSLIFVTLPGFGRESE